MEFWTVDSNRNPNIKERVVKGHKCYNNKKIQGNGASSMLMFNLKKVSIY